jgi:DNA-binding transcriptional LysR family regulator
MDRMNNEMKYIYEIYKQGSFSKAAKKLFITQPALSIAVRKVEKDLNMPLFNRKHNALTLTDAGEIYIKKAKLIRQIEEDLNAEISDIAELGSGSLKIGGTNYLNSYILPLVLSAFTKKFPKITISLIESGSVSVFGMMESGIIDVTFSCAELDAEIFSKTPVFNDNVLLAVPGLFLDEMLLPYALTKEQVLAKLHLTPCVAPANLSWFSHIPFILLYPGNDLYHRSMQFMRDANMVPKVVHQLDQLTTSYHLCCNQVGATFIGSLLVTVNSPPDVLYFPISSPLALRHFYAVTLKNRYLPISAVEFIKMISDLDI